jgi:hypothetical protein
MVIILAICWMRVSQQADVDFVFKILLILTVHEGLSYFQRFVFSKFDGEGLADG